MLSIGIDTKSLELVINHQFNNIELSFFANHMKSSFPLCTDIRYPRVERRSVAFLLNQGNHFPFTLQICVPLVLLVALVAADGGHRHSHGRSGRRGRQRSRGGRQDSSLDEPVQGGVDFSDCETQDDGMCCVMREEEITTIKKDPILECTHKSVEKCHYTYVTEFTPVQEEVCEENFEKKCQITFKQMAVTETVKKCYRPLMKTCGNEANPSRLRGKRQLAEYGDERDSGSLADANNEQCKTFYESACTTKYVEKQPGKFVGDTSCEKLPIELCGEGCRVEEGEEECHDKEIDTLIDVPEEVSTTL